MTPAGSGAPPRDLPSRGAAPTSCSGRHSDREERRWRRSAPLPSPAAPRRGVGGGLVLLLRLYQRGISPFLPPLCRYYPTCSQYAVEALQARGAWTGCWLALWRLLRCNPFCHGGFDPVPPRRR